MLTIEMRNAEKATVVRAEVEIYCDSEGLAPAVSATRTLEGWLKPCSLDDAGLGRK
jgi:hypothetical protein